MKLRSIVFGMLTTVWLVSSSFTGELLEKKVSVEDMKKAKSIRDFKTIPKGCVVYSFTISTKIKNDAGEDAIVEYQCKGEKISVDALNHITAKPEKGQVYYIEQIRQDCEGKTAKNPALKITVE